MRRTTFAGLLSLFAVIGIVSGGCSAHAAECTLTIAGSPMGQVIFQPVGVTIPWDNTVNLSSSDSTWTMAVAHFNNLTTSTTFSSTNPGGDTPSGGGDYPFRIAFPNSGTYECYVIDSGMAHGNSNPVGWSDSTNHIMETVHVGP